MPLFSEAASAIKSRFGFQDRAAAPDSVSAAPTTSPDLLKSVPRQNISSSVQSLVSKSSFRSIDEKGDDAVSANRLVQSFEFSEDPSFWKDHNVQVIIRVRPLSSSEISSQGYSNCVRQESCQTITWTGQPESRFTFDLVADETVSQEKLFKVAGVPMVENCMGGYNSCMFAYGQTGSGKTHTMLGDVEGGTRRHSVNCGMTPRTFEYLFSRIQKEKEARKDEHLKFTCRCSFLEIYNEQILDLLDPSSNNLQIREDVKKGLYVENLKEVEVASARDVIQQLIEGAANRKVAATNMNRASSRSHSVFTCIIESKWESQGVTHHRFARLNLVDLAGSERQKNSGAEGERLKEATNINKSLSTLGLVIMNLVSISNGKSLHVPYRDSKLTFLLQDSLGGNSKTTIIANISPSLCCSLETLSTLKFAQRAKFIKNNAIVNEDASGNVIAMRLQIQQLKKEVTRLRGLVVNNGSESLDNDTSGVGFPGSPGSFRWEGPYGAFSPLVSDKKMAQKKDYEMALVGAFRREKDKDIALKALAAENQAALHLAKQREDEIQSLKMRLRFREAAIKRLEAVASGKILAETHLLQEKEEHLREIEVLRNQVDRNQEVTRFAMENLQLKEEIRRLKSFYEGGEREMMSEQIMVLENKLLEALDWKLMHESDSQKVISDTKTDAHDNLLVSTQLGVEATLGASPWHSSFNEKNEFLRMQAIQKNQAELDTLEKQLDFGLAEKEKFERHVNGLVMELEEERSSRAAKERLQQIELPSLLADTSVINSNDEMELKSMVDAIAAASQREAEAHERAITLSMENEDMQLKLEAFTEENRALQAKLKALIEEKNSLIEMYERAASLSKSSSLSRAEINDMEPPSNGSEIGESAEIEMKIAIKNLEHQLLEMHEENDKLMGLYEKAMHERDEFKRMLSSSDRTGMDARGQYECYRMPVGFGECNESATSPCNVGSKYIIEEAILPSGLHVEGVGETVELETKGLPEVLSELNVHDGSGQRPVQVERTEGSWIPLVRNQSVEFTRHAEGDTGLLEESNMNCEGTISELQADTRNHIGFVASPCVETECGQNEPLNNAVTKVPEDLDKLKIAEDKLLDSAKILTEHGCIEDAFVEFDEILREGEETEKKLQEKQQELRSFELLSSDIQERKSLLHKKLSALRVSLSSFSSSVAYFEQREARARARLHALWSSMDHKKQELVHLHACKGEVVAAMGKIQQSEVELKNWLALLKSRFEEENRRQENEKVLFAIDNIEKTDASRISWNIGGKATDLLKSEEEKTKLQNEMKVTREKLSLVRGELEDLKKKSGKIESEIEAIQMDTHKVSKSVKEMELALHGVVQEKETLLEIRDNGMTEIQSMVIEYQQNVFDSDMKEVEIKMLEEDILQQSRRIEELRTLRIAAAEEMKKLFSRQRSTL